MNRYKFSRTIVIDSENLASAWKALRKEVNGEIDSYEFTYSLPIDFLEPDEFDEDDEFDKDDEFDEDDE